MKPVVSSGRDDLAIVHIVDFGDGRLAECVESLNPPRPREEKWILLVSTMFGCPIGCPMCDAGGASRGVASREEILAQIDWLVDRSYPGRVVPCRQFKIQFARMGEPALNPAVLDVLEELPERYRAPGLMPAVSTIAPAGTESFFERLIEIKDSLYRDGRFQMQFSLHSTEDSERDRLIPCRKWDLSRIASYGERFHRTGDRKVGLNFAWARDVAIDSEVLRRSFDPAKFLIKITPVNPTYRARGAGLESRIDPHRAAEGERLLDPLRSAGFEVLLSVGEVEENRIGSNCGQFVEAHLANASGGLEGGYADWEGGASKGKEAAGEPRSTERLPFDLHP